MRCAVLNTKASQRLKSGDKFFYEKDLQEKPSGSTPGEWLVFQNSEKQNYIGFINLSVSHGPAIRILGSLTSEQLKATASDSFVWNWLSQKIKAAILRRSKFKNYQCGSRVIFGDADGLPGLIVDSYVNCVIAQINTAGLDRYREAIKNQLQDHFKQKVILLDNEQYRKVEGLPVFEKDTGVGEIEIVENGIKYFLPFERMQKIGFYYDHRENRKKLEETLKQLNIRKQSGVDLFSYLGGWGFHLLRAGVEQVEFVDQGNFSEIFNKNVEANNFSNRAKFVREDVFGYLDRMIDEKRKFDVIVSDPPAFSKKEDQKRNAILGYEKLHYKLLQLVDQEAVVAIASCTHHLSHEELDKTVKLAAIKNKLKMQLLDMGVQGFDHPIGHLDDEGFYIKYLLYFVERE